MAVNPTLQQRLFKSGSLRQPNADRHSRWRVLVLIGAAAGAAAFTSYSLIVDPPDTAPAPTSYLP